ncbi:MAG TPA: hypothetical protein VML50_06270 [Anaeromyxobacter sp.]|nr:hypothetical protein [Anaeromyxobacter sp.]
MLHRATNAMAGWQRRTVTWAAVGLLATGLLWLPVHYLWGSGAGELPHPLEPWLMRGHGAAVLAAVFAAGTVASGHAQRGWLLGRKRASGVALWSLAAFLAASGFALSYLVPEGWRPAAGWAHAAAGLGAFLVGALHARPSRSGRGDATPPLG